MDSTAHKAELLKIMAHPLRGGIPGEITRTEMCVFFLRNFRERTRVKKRKEVLTERVFHGKPGKHMHNCRV